MSVDTCRYICMRAWRAVLIRKHVELCQVWSSTKSPASSDALRSNYLFPSPNSQTAWSSPPLYELCLQVYLCLANVGLPHLSFHSAHSNLPLTSATARVFHLSFCVSCPLRALTWTNPTAVMWNHFSWEEWGQSPACFLRSLRRWQLDSWADVLKFTRLL